MSNRTVFLSSITVRRVRVRPVFVSHISQSTAAILRATGWCGVGRVGWEEENGDKKGRGGR